MFKSVAVLCSVLMLNHSHAGELQAWTLEGKKAFALGDISTAYCKNLRIGETSVGWVSQVSKVRGGISYRRCMEDSNQPKWASATSVSGYVEWPIVLHDLTTGVQVKLELEGLDPFGIPSFCDDKLAYLKLKEFQATAISVVRFADKQVLIEKEIAPVSLASDFEGALGGLVWASDCRAVTWYYTSEAEPVAVMLEQQP